MKPHRAQYWLNPKCSQEEFDEKSQNVNEVYRKAPERAEQGVVTVSVDEKTGMQALERIAPDKDPLPGQIKKIEYEYKRHGTQVLTAAFDVATGEVMGTIGDQRREEDFVAFLDKLLASNPQAPKFHIVCDNLNTHYSEGVVHFVAERSGIDQATLGKKGKEGILRNRETRQAFLQNGEHKIVFHYTPRHCSWMNQVEIWFSVLARKVLRRGSFLSKQDLKEKVEAFVEYFNRTLARPYKWTYGQKPLAA